MKFNKINKIILFGGSKILTEFVKRIAKDSDIEIVVFSSKRHLDEVIDKMTMQKILHAYKVRYYNSPNINKDRHLPNEVNKNTLGIVLGAAWIFSKKTVDLFAKNHLVEFLPVNLPRYEGGAHETWRILHKSKKGGIDAQIVCGGTNDFHKGEVVKRINFKFSNKCKKPIDYINFIASKEIDFLKKLLNEIKQSKNFKLIKLDEKKSSYYPFLYTKFNGLINWSWSVKDLYLFINAFDDPYLGASTYLGKQRLFLKECYLEKVREEYHPFTAGLVIRKNEQGIFIAAVGGLLRIKTVLNEEEKNIINSIKLGDRLYTSQSKLDGAMLFQAVYNAHGIKK